MAICTISSSNVLGVSGSLAVRARLTITPVSVSGIVMATKPSRPTVANGIVEFTCVQGTTVNIKGDVLGFNSVNGTNVVVPSASTATFESLVAVASVSTTGLTVKDEGTALASLIGTLNFAGTGVVVTESPTGVALVTISATALDPTLTAIGGVTVAADQVIYATGADAFAATSFTAFGRSLVDDADASAGRTTLGLGSLATQSGTFSGTSSGTNTGDQTNISGNAGTATLAAAATVLATPRNINGVAFDGSAPITVTAAAGTLSGATLASGVTASSLTSFGASIALGTPGSGVLTSCTGLPLSTGVTGSLPIANGGTGQTTASAAFNALSPMTTQGDIIFGGASGAGTRLAKGTAGQVLTMNVGATAPEWAAAGGGGASLALDNLASVAINTSLIFAPDAVPTPRIIRTANQTTADTAGNALQLIAGNGLGEGASGASISVTAGNGSGTAPGGNGGSINLTGGNATLDAQAGSVTLTSGTVGDTSTDGLAGSITLQGGDTRVSSGGEQIRLICGNTVGTHAEGGTAVGIAILAGSAGVGPTDLNGGPIAVTAGNGVGTGTGGGVTITSGDGDSGGNVTFTAGDGALGGGNIVFDAGDADDNGGSIEFRVGDGTAKGVIKFVTATGDDVVLSLDLITAQRQFDLPDLSGIFALTNAANVWGVNVRQVFAPGENAAGLNVGAVAADPDTPVNADIWYDSVTNELKAQINGVTKVFAFV